MGKAFEKLQIKDDFMFSVIMRNPRFCKPFLERILNIKISRIEYPKSQETIDISADAKSVRLDIYVEDGKETVYNIEMQTTENRNLPKRTRYYQGDEAVQSVRKNEKWRLDYMTLQMNYQEKYEQGIEQGNKQAALRMIEAGKLSYEEIAMYSGLTLEQVLELQKEVQLV